MGETFCKTSFSVGKGKTKKKNFFPGCKRRGHFIFSSVIYSNLLKGKKDKAIMHVPIIKLKHLESLSAGHQLHFQCYPGSQAKKIDAYFIRNYTSICLIVSRCVNVNEPTLGGVAVARIS